MPQGHPSALGELGRLHAVGHGRERNYHTALKYLLQGAHLADPTGTASAMLGHLLLRKVRPYPIYSRPLSTPLSILT